jgi:hypothetical protein
LRTRWGCEDQSSAGYCAFLSFGKKRRVTSVPLL